MFMLYECLVSSLASIRANAFRSALTMLGIIVGVGSVIASIGLVQALSGSITRQFTSLGSDLLTIRAETPIEDALRGKVNRLRITDLEQIKHRIDGIRYVTPVIVAGGRSGTEVRSGRNITTSLMLGTTPGYQDVRQSFPLYGRFLTESDNVTRRRVVVLGDRVRRDLKLPPDPTGQYIQTGGEWLKIVGVMEPRGEMFGLSQDNFLLVPYQTALTMTSSLDDPDISISFAAINVEDSDAVRSRVTVLLREIHGLKPGQANDFTVESSDTLKKTLGKITTMATLVVAGVVSISMLVGGIGIMNIMLVSVTERTREIGIMKALGAPREFILLQFLLEAALLSLLGGVIGTALGYGTSLGIAALIPEFSRPTIPLWAVAGSWSFSGLIGVVFGILPASNAANMESIEALRYE